MSEERCRWRLIDLGAFRRAHWCSTHRAWRHPFACFDADGTLVCCCGVDANRRPVAPKEQAIA